jgi:hypothetical protein
LPSGPGNVGTFDAPSILVLTGVGIPRNAAISYQFLLHAVLWCTETFAGLWFMWRGGLRKADLEWTLAEQPGWLNSQVGRRGGLGACVWTSASSVQESPAWRLPTI